MKDDLNRIEREHENRLNEPGQLWVRETVRALPEETPSLAWRSNLNAAIAEQAQRQRKARLFGWVWKPSAGIALASCLALLVIAQMPKPQAPESKADIESAIVNSYLHSKTSWELTGDGVTTSEAQDVSGSKEPDWFREDVGATL